MLMEKIRTMEHIHQKKEFSIEERKKIGKEISELSFWEGSIAIFVKESQKGMIGLSLAFSLKQKGKKVTVFFVNPIKKYSEGKTIRSKQDLFSHLKEPFTILVDAMNDREEPLSVLEEEVISYINQIPAFKVSLDMNSGLSISHGFTKIAFISDLTIAIGSYTPGHFLNMAKDYISCLIKLEDEEEQTFYSLFQKEDAKMFLTPRKNKGNKGDYGTVAMIGGCSFYMGSMKLANLATSVLRSGAGVIRLIVAESEKNSISPYILESTLFLVPSKNGHMLFSEELKKSIENINALAIGMGWGTSKENEKILSYILQNFEKPLILDADGLNTLSKMDLSILKKTKATVVLTPHVKEFSRLSGYSKESILKNGIVLAKKFAKQYHVFVLLKGETTILTDGKEVIFVSRGCAGMATAGSGDVLSGVLLGLLGYLPCTLPVLATAAYVNGLAGELAQQQKGSISMIASDTVRKLPQAILEIQK